jgi:hypothetical protein
MVEEVFKDLPKHLRNFGETAVAVGHDLVNRFWTAIAEINRRVEEKKNKGDTSTTTTKRTTTTRNSLNKK